MDVHQLSSITAWMLTGIIVTMILYDLSHDLHRVLTGKTMVMLSILMWYLLEAVRLPDDLNIYSQTDYDLGIGIVGLTFVVFLAGYHRGRSYLFDDLSARLVRVESDRILWILFLCGIGIGILPTLAVIDFDFMALFDGLLGGSSRWSSKLSRGRMGGFRDVLIELQMFLRAVVPLATVILFSKQSTVFKKAICLAFITWMLLRANASGLRSSVIPIILPIAAAVFWKSSTEMRKWQIAIGIPLAIIGGYYYAAFAVANRNAGTHDFVAAAHAAENYTGFEMFRELLYIVDNVPENVDYQFGKSYANQIINPIPRFIWTSKPVWDSGILLAISMGNVDSEGVPYMTSSPGFIGEAYLNFGVVGLVIVPFVAGIVVRAWDRLLAWSGQSFLLFVVYAAGLANILASGRSISISAFYGLIALYVLLALLEFVLGVGAAPQSPGRPMRTVGSQSR